LNADPDPAIQINADPDPETSDPKKFEKVLIIAKNCQNRL
jgi:hypothetical protein